MSFTDTPLLFTKKEFLSESPIFTNVVVCDNIYNPNCTLSELHLHEFVEFSVVISGTGIHRIFDKVQECKKGDLYIFNTGVPHCYFAASSTEKPTVLNVLFDQRLLDGNNEQDSCYGVFGKEELVSHYRFSHEQLKKIIDLCNDIKDELLNKDLNWQEMSVINLKNLLITTRRFIKDKGKSDLRDELNGNALVYQAIKYTLENYYKQDFTLDKLASSLFVSKGHLSRLWFRTSGEHFSSYVRNLKIKHAAMLLETTDLKNDEIVVSSGFKDIPTFYKVFKKVYGLSPKQYKLNAKSLREKL